MEGKALLLRCLCKILDTENGMRVAISALSFKEAMGFARTTHGEELEGHAGSRHLCRDQRNHEGIALNLMNL